MTNEVNTGQDSQKPFIELYLLHHFQSCSFCRDSYYYVHVEPFLHQILKFIDTIKPSWLYPMNLNACDTFPNCFANIIIRSLFWLTLFVFSLSDSLKIYLIWICNSKVNIYSRTKYKLIYVIQLKSFFILHFITSLYSILPPCIKLLSIFLTDYMFNFPFSWFWE